MNGVINIYKEKGYGSFHVDYEIRKMSGEKKVGHTGTLDPDACGVLPVCIGKATKLVGRLTDTDKVYRTGMLLGRRTDTQDVSGNTLEEMSTADIILNVSADKIIAAVMSFVGDIRQVPPMYSALKVGGVKLVDAARKGQEIERQARTVKIYSIEDIGISDDLQHVCFTVRCSKGTYIRTLCEDIGKRLGIPACMESLERTETAGLGIDSAITLEKAKEYAMAGELESHLIPVDSFFACYGKAVVADESVRRLTYGNYLFPEDFTDTDVFGMDDGTILKLYDSKGEFYALYRLDSQAGCLKCEKMFRDID